MAVRHVRTPEGKEKYGEEIGAIIHPHLPEVHPGPRRPIAMEVGPRVLNAWANLDPDVASILTRSRAYLNVWTEAERSALVRSAEKHGPGGGSDKPALRRAIGDIHQTLQSAGAFPPARVDLDPRFAEGGVADDVQLGLARIRAAFPNAPHERLAKVTVNDDQVALGNKSNIGISVNPVFFGDTHDNWGPTSPDTKARLSVGRDRADIISHEYGHVLFTWLMDTNPSAAQALSDWLEGNEDYVDWEGKHHPMKRRENGAFAPSIYATESPYEFMAEAVLDVVKWGDRARDSSRQLADLLRAGFDQ